MPKLPLLVKDSEALIKNLDDLVKKIYNPKAEVGHDILAFMGGAKKLFTHSFSARRFR